MFYRVREVLNNQWGVRQYDQDNNLVDQFVCPRVIIESICTTEINEKYGSCFLTFGEHFRQLDGSLLIRPCGIKSPSPGQESEAVPVLSPDEPEKN